MPVQTAYTTYHEVATPGQRADFTLTNITSKVVETADIPFGRAVVAGTADNQCKLAGGAGTRFIGVSEYTSAGTYQADGDHLYEVEREANILDFGKVWVTAEVTVAAGEAVYYRTDISGGGAEILGGFSNVLDVDNILIPGAYWATSATAGDLAQIFVTVLGPLA